MGAIEAGTLLGILAGGLCVLTLMVVVVVVVVVLVLRRRRDPDDEDAEETAAAIAAPQPPPAAGAAAIPDASAAAGPAADEPWETTPSVDPAESPTVDPEEAPWETPAADSQSDTDDDLEGALHAAREALDAFGAAAVGGEAAAGQTAGSRPLKKATCPSCGASKVRPPVTAYVYCDYCGSLSDWDFRIACESSASALPGPAYEELAAELQPQQDAALAAGDQATYRTNLTRLFDSHMTACPASYSPRIGDPEYRGALLEFTTNSYALAAFDPTCQALEARMNEAIAGIGWDYGADGPSVEPASFRALVEAFWNYSERFIDLSAPILDQHPDRPGADLSRAIAASTFLQGWLPYLGDDDQAWVIERLGLGGEYVFPQPVDTTERHCGGCGATLAVVAGAKRVVCEHCGVASDVGHGEIACTSCGGALSIPHGKSRFACPHCSADLRVDGITPSWFS